MDQNIESEILEKHKLCKVLKVFKIVSFIGIFAPFVAFMVVSRNGYELDSAWLLIPALFVGGFFLFSYMETNKLKDLKELMGQYVVRSVLGERFHVIEYMPNGYTNEAFLHNCPILPSFNNMDGSDFIHGIYRGVEFTFSDLTLRTETKGSPDGEFPGDNVVNFKGQLITATSHKNVNGFVHIQERISRRMKNEKKSGILSSVLSSGDSCNSFMTGNASFDNRFDIYASDSQLALRVLTPQLMQGFMGLEGFMEIQIAGNMVAVAIKNDRDLFELSNNGRDNGDMEEYRQKFRDELSDILKVIDVFGMNTDLFQ